MENSINQRVRQLLKNKKISVSSIADELNVAQTTLNSQINNENYLKASTLLAIVRKFPDVSLEWLISGEGEMFKNIQHLENVQSSVTIGRDANGADIKINYQAVEDFMNITKKYQEQTDRMLAIIEKNTNK